MSEDLRMSEAAGMPAGGSGLSGTQIYIGKVSNSYIAVHRKMGRLLVNVQMLMTSAP